MYKKPVMQHQQFPSHVDTQFQPAPLESKIPPLVRKEYAQHPHFYVVFPALVTSTSTTEEEKPKSHLVIREESLDLRIPRFPWNINFPGNIHKDRRQKTRESTEDTREGRTQATTPMRSIYPKNRKRRTSFRVFDLPPCQFHKFFHFYSKLLSFEAKKKI